MRLTHDKAFYSGTLAGIAMKLQGHCDSDEAVWAALTSGCFRDVSIPDSWCSGYVAGWWSPAFERPTFNSVVSQW